MFTQKLWPVPSLRGCRRICVKSNRHYSTPASQSSIETVEVPVGSNGFLTLSIQKSSASSIILHFPRGPFNKSPASSALESALRKASSTNTIVTIHYRCDVLNQFPTPIHDAVAGYDWVLENLVKSSSRDSIRLTACGELLGGGLATMLALTESHRHKIGISALALLNPILDWTFPDAEEFLEDLKPLTKKSQLEPSWRRLDHNFSPSAAELLNARSYLFSDRSGYFDQFASPLHFFRTPRIEYYSVSELMQRDHSDDDTASSSPNALTDFELKEMQTYRSKRSYHLTFPPTNSLLRLPRTLIAHSLKSPLEDQASELASLMRRSIMANEFGIRRTRGLGSLKKVLLDSEEDTSGQPAKPEVSEKEIYAASTASKRIQNVSFEENRGEAIFTGLANGMLCST